MRIHFISGETVRYRVYESMYDRAKDAFYQGDDKYDFIIGYVEVKSLPEYWSGDETSMSVTRNKAFINMRNVCHIEIVGKCNGHD